MLELSQLCWCEFNAADRQVVLRLPTVPQHDRGGFVGGDALDHAAPIGPDKLVLVLVERGCGACGELYPVPSLDHLHSYAQRRTSRIFWLGGVAYDPTPGAFTVRDLRRSCYFAPNFC